MGKKSKKGSGSGLWLLGVLACLAAAGGVYYYLAVLGGNVEPVRRPGSRPPVVSVSEQRKMVLYLPKETKSGFVLAPVSRTIERKGSILDAAVNALLATNKEPGVVGNLIPKGTKLLAPVKVEKGVATVNLSPEFVNNFAGGSDLEGLMVNAIVATVVSSSEGKADRVLIRVDGKVPEPGNYDLTDPLTPEPAFVKSEKGN
jgi:spore germination protein GerM